MRITCFLFFLTLSTVVPAQIDESNIPEGFRNEDAVFEDFQVQYTIDMGDDGFPEVKAHYFFKRFFLSPRARFYTEESIYDSYFNKVENIEISQFNLTEKGKYKKSKVNLSDTVKPYSSSIFYDDLIALKYNFVGLDKGSYTIMEYDEVLMDYHFFGREALASYLPIMEGAIEVRLDKNIEIAFQEHNFDDHNISFSRESEGKYEVYRWKLHHIDPIRPGENMSPLFSLVPNLTFQITKFNWEGKEESVFSDTNHMYDWYYSKVSEVMKEENDSLKTFTLSLLNDTMSDFEKVKTIYYWVQKNVKYVAIEYGEGAIVPRPPYLVYDRRYGDCKDMACLTKKMISYAGLEANLVWIGTRDLPYGFREVPSPMVTNHMICSYREGKKIYFLDATSTSNPISMPSTGIQGKEALIELGEGNYSIVNVPVPGSEESGKIDSCDLKIDNTALVGQCKCTYSGYTAIIMRQILSMSSETDKKNFFSLTLNKGSNKFILENYKVLNIEDYDKDIEIEYEFSIKDYAKEFENQLFVNVNVSQYLRGNKFDMKSFKYDYEGDYKFYDKEVNVLQLPDDFEVSSLPESWVLKERDYRFGIHYKNDLSSRTIRMERNISVDYLKYPVDRFSEWNSSIDKLNNNYKKMVVLEKR